MKKALKFILSFVSVIIILAITVPIALSMLLQIGMVQNFAVDRVTKILSEKSETTMSISKIKLDFFSKLVIDDAYIEDPVSKDTLIYIKKIKVEIDGINFTTGKISLGSVEIDQGQCNLLEDSTGIMNIQRIFDKFKSKESKQGQSNFRMTARDIVLNNFHFKMYQYDAQQKTHGINFQQLDLSQIFLQARDLSIFNYDILVKFEQLSFRDKSGFYLQQFSSPRCVVNETGMRFEKLRLDTQRSLLRFEHVYLLYDNWYAYNDFVNKVNIDVEILPSRLAYRTLSFFTGQENTIPTTIELSGRIRGPVPNLHGYLNNVSTQNTRFSTEFSVVGLPNIKNTTFNLALYNLNTTARDVETIYGELTNRSLAGVYPILEHSGNIVVDGTFEGLLSDFLATANVRTALGTMSASLNVTPKPQGGGTRMIGKLTTPGYNIGATLGIQEIGNIVCDANVDIELAGVGNTSMIAKASVPSLQVLGYHYKDVEIDGRFEGRTYEGEIKINDPNCILKTKGFFDLTSDVPKYNYMMDLTRANLYALKINERDSISVLSAKFTSSGSGSKLDNLNGVMDIEKLIYVNHVDSVSTGSITLTAKNDEDYKSMVLESDFADVKLGGTNSYSEIFRYLAETFTKYVPAYPEVEAVVVGTKTNKKNIALSEPPPFKEGSYEINVEVKRANNVASIFVPGLQLATGTSLDFKFNPQTDSIRLSLNSEYIGTNTDYLYRISLDSRNRADSILFSMAIESCEIGGLFMPNLTLDGDVKNNMIKANLKFNNPADGTMADIMTTTSFYRAAGDLPQIKVALDRSLVALEYGEWTISPTYAIFDTTGVYINNFEMTNSAQRLHVDGRIGRSIRDTITVDLDNFDISPVSMLTSSLGYQLHGSLNGSAKGYALLGYMEFDANINLDSLALNEHKLGNPNLRCEWNPQRKSIDFRLLSKSENGANGMPVWGYFDILNNKFEVRAKFPNFNMAYIEPLLQGILSNTEGSANVDVTLTGDKGVPTLTGDIDVKNYAFTVDYTKARYNLKGKVDVINTCFKADELPLTDNMGGTGIAKAYLDTDHFKNLRFGVTLKFNNLLVLNTTERDNDIFYGKAYGTNGTFSVEGNDRSTKLNITAETAKESEFNLPFSSAASIAEAKFITFVDSREKKETGIEQYRKFFRSSTDRVRYTNELDIVINLHVMQNTLAKISMVNDYMGDKLMENTIVGRGDGRFNLHINPDLDIFTMTGRYDITKNSKYTLDFATVIDKKLDILPNSSITWSGDPADPEFNIDAVYKVKTSLAPLMNSASNGRSSNTQLDCGVKLTGRMSTPKMQFSITAPQADPEKQSVLRNLLNTEEIINSQFFALFVAGSFTPDAGASSLGSMGTSLAAATGVEFLSNQISNMISSDKVAVKLGYRPRTEYTSDEINLGFETDIITNKLTLEVGANINTLNNKMYNDIPPFSGDAYLTWILNKPETIKLRGFTRVIERLDETQGLQETGVGISFRQDFDNVAEIRQKWRLWQEAMKRKHEAKRQERIAEENKSDTLHTPVADTIPVSQPVKSNK